MEAQAKRRYTVAEYFALEAESPTKHEYYRGEMIAMAGASWNHGVVVINLTLAFGARLQGTECQLSPSDMRVRVTEAVYAYPDLTIVCGRVALSDDPLDTLTNPTAIFEVLSASTRGYDRGDKFVAYRAIPTLRDYVLLEQDRPHVEHFRKSDAGLWILHEYDGADAVLELPSIDVRAPLGEIYQRVEFRTTG